MPGPLSRNLEVKERIRSLENLTEVEGSGPASSRGAVVNRISWTSAWGKSGAASKTSRRASPTWSGRLPTGPPEGNHEQSVGLPGEILRGLGGRHPGALGGLS